jgi:L-alanine-DL-glutamate epimerase-like enolase superfamily enzyme
LYKPKPVARGWLDIGLVKRYTFPRETHEEHQPEVIDEELRVLREHGITLTRSFFYWPDFMPAENTLDPRMTARYDYESARRTALPVEETWDTRAYLRHVPAVFEPVRAEFGPELPLLHDGHHRMTPLQAARLGTSLEPYDLFWLEDATPGEDQAVLRYRFDGGLLHPSDTPGLGVELDEAAAARFPYAPAYLPVNDW